MHVAREACTYCEIKDVRPDVRTPTLFYNMVLICKENVN